MFLKVWGRSTECNNCKLSHY